MQPLKRWAFIIAAASLAFDGAAFVLGFLSLAPGRETPAFDWMVLAGGPVVLLIFAPVSLRWERLSASCLWLGSAVAAIGLSLRSGPHVGRYFISLAAIVLPQVVVAGLLTVLVRRKEKAERQRKKGR